MEFFFLVIGAFLFPSWSFAGLESPIPPESCGVLLESAVQAGVMEPDFVAQSIEKAEKLTANFESFVSSRKIPANLRSAIQKKYGPPIHQLSETIEKLYDYLSISNEQFSQAQRRSRELDLAGDTLKGRIDEDLARIQGQSADFAEIFIDPAQIVPDRFYRFTPTGDGLPIEIAFTDRFLKEMNKGVHKADRLSDIMEAILAGWAKHSNTRGFKKLTDREGLFELKLPNNSELHGMRGYGKSAGQGRLILMTFSKAPRDYSDPLQDR